MIAGAALALAAGLMWGLVFVGPLLLPEYPATLLSFGRYVAFGVLALALAWPDRARLAGLDRADWVAAAKLGLVGNIVYYLFLAAAIQRAGAPLPTMIIGTLPVVIAVVERLRPARQHAPPGTPAAPRLPWRRLAPSLALIAVGIAAVDHAELAVLARATGGPARADLARYALGAALALGAVACWTWYPIRNADWLRTHPQRSPRAWATAQGLATLPLALAGYAATWAWMAWRGETFPMPLGPRPLAFVALMAAIGLFASWLGTLCWNEASRRLPTTLVGQLIVFETLAALAYAYALRREPPPPAVVAGIAMLVAGVVWALRAASAEQQCSRKA